MAKAQLWDLCSKPNVPSCLQQMCCLHGCHDHAVSANSLCSIWQGQWCEAEGQQQAWQRREVLQRRANMQPCDNTHLGQAVQQVNALLPDGRHIPQVLPVPVQHLRLLLDAQVQLLHHAAPRGKDLRLGSEVLAAQRDDLAGLQGAHSTQAQQEGALGEWASGAEAGDASAEQEQTRSTQLRPQHVVCCNM
jgi:hypothetical protein